MNEFGLQFYETVKPVEAHDKGYNTFLFSDATSAFNNHLTTEEFYGTFKFR